MFPIIWGKLYMFKNIIIFIKYLLTALSIYAYQYFYYFYIYKLQPAIFPLSINTSFVFPNYQLKQMQRILPWAFIVDWNSSGIMTSKLVICESESPRPADSLILISRMMSSSVIIPYRTYKQVLPKTNNPKSGSSEALDSWPTIWRCPMIVKYIYT